MNALIFALSFLRTSSSNTKPNKFPHKHNLEIKSQDYLYSDEGFYQTMLNEKDTINVKFSNQSLRLFFFIPDHPNFFIDDIKIDGKSVGSVVYRGLSIEGVDNATIKFDSKVPNQQIPAEFWLIRSSFCPNPAIYLYGNQKMEFVTSVGNKLCIFSPSFDSKNHEFKIRFGITKEFKESFSKLYTKKFDAPDETNSGTEVRSYNIARSSFVQFRGTYNSFLSDHSKEFSTKESKNLSEFSSTTSKKLPLKSSQILKNDYSGSFVYERITKVEKYKKTPCTVDFLLRCKSNGCWSDHLSEFYWGCSDSKDLNIFMIVAIILAAAVLLIIFSWGIVICVKKKNIQNESYFNSLLSDQNDNINKITPISYT